MDNKLPEFMTIPQAAKKLNLPQNLLRTLKKDGIITGVQSGNRVYINMDDLIKYLSTNKIK